MRTCSIADCKRKHAAHGWCYSHWRQWKRTGAIGPIKKATWIKPETPASDRFWAKVKKGPNCWEWTGAHTDAGYGVLFSAGRMELAHRLSWKFANGNIPARMHVLHRCDNPPCTNPGHLFLGTPRQNMLDKVAKNRHGCLRGQSHPCAVVTEKVVAEIKRRILRNDERQADICREMGLRQSMVSAIVTGRTWRHVA